MIPNTQHFPGERDAEYSRMAMGIAWPAKRPGFVAVVGEHRRECVGGKPRLDVLDEASDDVLWRVVEKAAGLAFYYGPEFILADSRHVAAMQFVQEFADRGLGRVEGSLLCAMEGPCAYAFPIVGRLLSSGRLVLPEAARLRGELMTGPAHEDLSKLLLGDYPGLAALAFAVLELERTRESPGRESLQGEVDRGGRILP